jgi:hypothetical protein
MGLEPAPFGATIRRNVLRHVARSVINPVPKASRPTGNNLQQRATQPCWSTGGVHDVLHDLARSFRCEGQASAAHDELSAGTSFEVLRHGVLRNSHVQISRKSSVSLYSVEVEVFIGHFHCDQPG